MEVKVRIDPVNKIIYGSEPICNRYIYSEVVEEWRKKYISIQWPFTTKDDILGSDDMSTTVRHSFKLNKDWTYKQEIK
ncbi:MAG: hypothetical protein PVG65_01185 [Candidatus Thorarchaeota archaeon]|jgi:hypothetical protein